jgi:hypothetical protein
MCFGDCIKKRGEYLSLDDDATTYLRDHPYGRGCFAASSGLLLCSIILYVVAVGVGWFASANLGFAGAVVISLPVLAPAGCLFLLFGSSSAPNCDCLDDCSGYTRVVGIVVFMTFWIFCGICLVSGGFVFFAAAARESWNPSNSTNVAGVLISGPAAAIAAGMFAVISGALCMGSLFGIVFLYKVLCTTRRGKT